jgi:MafB19-like deaminase
VVGGRAGALRELALEALARLLAHQTKADEPPAAVATVLRLLALDPLFAIDVLVCPRCGGRRHIVASPALLRPPRRKPSPPAGQARSTRQGPLERLSTSVLYTTVEPCPMCAWVICLAGIARVVIGVRHADMGVSHGGYAIERLIEMTGQPLQVEAGPVKDECAALRLRTIPR